MQNIIIEKPYKFIPPEHNTWWSTLIQTFNLYGSWLRKSEGVVDFELRHEERLVESLSAGHGILLTPNHSRPGDPLVMGKLARTAKCHFFAMASWHLFHQGRFNAWAIRKMGGFSVYREGVDRKAIDTAIRILETAERPLFIFPEGATTRTNDRLHALLDGVAFIARTAAKRRAKANGGKVVVHPIGLKYLFQGDLAKQGDEVLTEIEERFSWRPQRHATLMQRITKVGRALLSLKEIEFFGDTQSGSLADRQQGLLDRLLIPIEEEWFDQAQQGQVIPRIKNLRMKILPDMVGQRVEPDERERRWGQLADLYLAQQVSCYPVDYLVEYPSVDRVLETLERFEEDLTDRVRVHGALKVILEVDKPIDVDVKRDRRAPVDPLMAKIEDRLKTMLGRLAKESPLWEEPEAASSRREDAGSNERS